MMVLVVLVGKVRSGQIRSKQKTDEEKQEDFKSTSTSVGKTHPSSIT